MHPDGRLAPRLVGRDEALGRLTRVVESARRGVGGALLVSGPAGMGKTALLRAGLTQVHDLDVCWGTAVETGGPGYWPWLQALTGLVRVTGLDRARAAAGADAGLLASLVPALGEGVVDSQRSDRDRMLLFDAVVAWLHALGSERPVVVVLDDLQWADASTMALLELVVRDPRPAAVAVLGAFRADDLGQRGGRLTALLGPAEHVELRGLDRAGSALLARELADAELPSEVLDDVFRRAGGHPFFTRELVMAATGGAGAGEVPAAVRDAVARRLDALSEDERVVLRAAALAGAQVRPDVVAAVCARPVADVARTLDGAVEAGVLQASDDGLRWAHDIFRETVVAGVPADDRGRLHLAVAQALEVRAERLGEPAAPASLAAHYTSAVQVAGVEPATRWALRAAAADRAALALDESAGHLRRLRAAVVEAGLAVPDPDLVDVLLAEADALARIGRSPDARGLLRSARSAAERAGDGTRVAEVALAVAALGSQFAARRDDVVDELTSALDHVAGSDPAVEARLTATLARELAHSVAAERGRGEELSERALALGRASDDPDVLATCLRTRHDVLWALGRGAERAAVLAELVPLARRSGDPERLAEALLLEANSLLEGGDAGFAATLDESLRLFESLGQPRHDYTVRTRRACLALLTGDLEAAERLIEEAAELGERIREPDAQNVRMSQRLELARTRRDVDELRAFAADAVRHWTGAPVHAHAVAAGFCARAGDLDATRHHLAAVGSLGGWRADRSYLWSVFVRELAVAAVALPHPALCAELLDELAAIADRCGVNGAVVAFAGAHAHTAGLLAGALGRADDAASYLADAGAVYERIGARHLLAEVRGQRGDTAAGPSSAAGVLRRRGTVWDVTWAGRSASMAHAKGLLDLASLLSRPGVDVHVLDLMGSALAPNGSDEVLDRQAAASYRSRLAALSDDRASAETDGDTARLAAIDAETDAIGAELRGGVGLGGRSRRFASTPSERARKAVAARLRDAVRRIEPVLPELAAHLDQHLVTGVHCRYRGDAAWVVDSSNPSDRASARR